MAQKFNIVAQLQLRGPTNLSSITRDIQRKLSNINVSVNVRMNRQTQASINSLSQSLNTVAQNAAKAQKSINNLNKANATAANAAKQNAQNLQEAATAAQAFGKQSALAVKRFAAFSIGAGIMYGFVNALREGTKAAIDFERELVKIAQVTGKSMSSLGGLTREITNLSTSLGVASSELVDVSRILSQTGLSANQVKVALKTLAQSSLAPTFRDMANTAEGAIAIMRQFGVTADGLSAKLGSINALAGQFAVESQDLIFAIRRAGGAFQAAGGQLEELLALFTSVRATTRESAETIATGFRTIFTRMQRPKTIEFLRSAGVELHNLAGNFVGPYEAVRRLNKALSQLESTDPRFQKIIEELGGFRQVSKVIPLIQQFGTAQQALKVAMQGQDSLAKDAATAQQTLAVQIVKVKEEFFALFRSIGQSATFRGFAKVALNLASSLVRVGEAIEPILPLLAALGTFQGIRLGTQFVSGFAGGLRGQGGAAGIGANVSKNVTGQQQQQQQTAQVQKLVSALTSNTQAVSANTTATQTNNTSLTKLTTAVTGLPKQLRLSMPMGGRRRGFNTGGLVPGAGNYDTVPAMLTPGEFVVRKDSVRKYGADNLRKMNAGGRVTPDRNNYGTMRMGDVSRRRRLGGGARGEYYAQHRADRFSKRMSGKGRRAYAFDFDDTLAVSDAVVREGAADPFMDFRGSRAGKFIRSARSTRYAAMARTRAQRGHDIFVVTARPGDPETKRGIGHFMRGIGAPAKKIIGTGGFSEAMGGTSIAKATVLAQLRGAYKDIVFLDDDIENVLAASKVKGVKSIGVGKGGLKRFAAGGRVTSGRHNYGVEVTGAGIRTSLQGMMKTPTYDPTKKPVLKDGLSTLTAIGEGAEAEAEALAEPDVYAGAFLRPAGANKYSRGFSDPNELKAALTGDNAATAAADKLSSSSPGRLAKAAIRKKIKARVERIINRYAKKNTWGFEAASLSVSKSEQIEGTLLKGIHDTVRKASNQLSITSKTRMGSSEIAKSMKNANVDQTMGNLFEQMLTYAGAPYGNDLDPPNAPFDFPKGLGASAGNFGLKATSVPTDAKTTYTEGNVQSFIHKVEKYNVQEAKKEVDKVIMRYLRTATRSQLSSAFGDNYMGRIGAAGGKFDAPKGKAGRIKFFASGGDVSGSDTVPAMLTPGEFVVNRKSAQRIGYNNLHAINQGRAKGYAAGGKVTPGRHAYGLGAPGTFSAMNMKNYNSPGNPGSLPAMQSGSGSAMGGDKMMMMMMAPMALDALTSSLGATNEGFKQFMAVMNQAIMTFSMFAMVGSMLPDWTGESGVKGALGKFGKAIGKTGGLLMAAGAALGLAIKSWGDKIQESAIKQAENSKGVADEVAARKQFKRGQITSGVGAGIAGGAVTGGLAGAAIGMIGGPIGSAVGAAIGAGIGGLTGALAGWLGPNNAIVAAIQKGRQVRIMESMDKHLASIQKNGINTRDMSMLARDMGKEMEQISGATMGERGWFQEGSTSANVAGWVGGLVGGAIGGAIPGAGPAGAVGGTAAGMWATRGILQEISDMFGGSEADPTQLQNFRKDFSSRMPKIESLLLQSASQATERGSIGSLAEARDLQGGAFGDMLDKVRDFDPAVYELLEEKLKDQIEASKKLKEAKDKERLAIEALRDLVGDVNGLRDALTQASDALQVIGDTAQGISATYTGGDTQALFGGAGIQTGIFAKAAQGRDVDQSALEAAVDQTVGKDSEAGKAALATAKAASALDGVLFETAKAAQDSPDKMGSIFAEKLQAAGITGAQQDKLVGQLEQMTSGRQESEGSLAQEILDRGASGTGDELRKGLDTAVLTGLQDIAKAIIDSQKHLYKMLNERNKMEETFSKRRRTILNKQAALDDQAAKFADEDYSPSRATIMAREQRQVATILGPKNAGLAGNAAGMGGRLRAVNDDILAQRDFIKGLDATDPRIAAATKTLKDLEDESKRLTQGLEHMGSSTAKLTALQSKLAKEQKKREVRTGILKDVAFGTDDERQGFVQQMLGARALASGMNPQDIQNLNGVPGLGTEYMKGGLALLEKFDDAGIQFQGRDAGSIIEERTKAQIRQDMQPLVDKGLINPADLDALVESEFEKTRTEKQLEKDILSAQKEQIVALNELNTTLRKGITLHTDQIGQSVQTMPGTFQAAQARQQIEQTERDLAQARAQRSSWSRMQPTIDELRGQGINQETATKLQGNQTRIEQIAKLRDGQAAARALTSINSGSLAGRLSEGLGYDPTNADVGIENRKKIRERLMQDERFKKLALTDDGMKQIDLLVGNLANVSQREDREGEMQGFIDKFINAQGATADRLKTKEVQLMKEVEKATGLATSQISGWAESIRNGTGEFTTLMDKISTLTGLKSWDDLAGSLAELNTRIDTLNAKLREDKAKLDDAETATNPTGATPTSTTYSATGGYFGAGHGMPAGRLRRGTDTRLAVLTPGEFVVNRRAASKNRGLLSAINSGAVISASSGGPIEYLQFGSGGRRRGRQGVLDMSFISQFNDSARALSEALRGFDISKMPDYSTLTSALNNFVTGTAPLVNALKRFTEVFGGTPIEVSLNSNGIDISIQNLKDISDITKNAVGNAVSAALQEESERTRGYGNTGHPIA